MFQRIGRVAFLVGAGIALFGAIVHWAALFVSPDWAAFLRAPSWAVDSFRDGTWIGPAGGIAIGVLMLLCALYAFVGIRWMGWIPMTRIALPTITSICILRGLLVIPSITYAPTGFNIVGSLIWLIAGLCFFVGTVSHWSSLQRHSR
jgi:hypothetical protein